MAYCESTTRMRSRLSKSCALLMLALQNSEPPELARPSAALDVVPTQGFRSRGTAGGPFFPESKVFLIYNTGSSSLSWTVRCSEPWLETSPRAGTLEPGARTSVVVSVLEKLAADLTAGEHRALVEFQDSGTDGRIARTIELEVRPKRGLQIVPATDFLWTAVRGSEEEPPKGSFRVGNASSLQIEWQARTTEDWLRLSPDASTIEPHHQEQVKVWVDAEVLDRLELGLHRAEIDFTNRSDGVGDTTREVRLLVRGAKGLSVMPELDLAASAFLDSDSHPIGSYTLRNEGTETIHWRAVPSERWIFTDPAQGELDSNAQVEVAVFVQEDPSKDEQGKPLRGALAFVNRTDGVGTTSRWIRVGDPQPNEHGGVELHETKRASSLSQFGITWTFDRPYEVGHFINGDWWVVGPVQLISIVPPSWRSKNRTRNGSTVNPSPRSGMTQGYDSACYGQYADKGSFDPRLNVAADLAAMRPLFIHPNTSLVSTISNVTAGTRPQLKIAAILTVLDTPAPPESFRPPYCGDDKTIRYSASQIDATLLAKLAPVPSTPSWSEVERWFERPWIDHVSLWAGNYIHPTKNMPNYGRDICDQVSTAALMLHLDVSDEQKSKLLVRFVQLGIDLWGIAQNGGDWAAAAGHMSGRKWPILFAGLVLGDAAMSGVGFASEIDFGEDGQTFYVEETPPGSGVYNHGNGGYGPQHVGMPEWGTAHARQPWWDDATWFGDGYRLCCTANTWWGQLLAAHVMGVKALWNHDALFDYQDRYLRENLARGIRDWRLAWRDFYLDMWKAYRPNY